MAEDDNTNVKRGREYLRCKLASLLWEQKVPRPDDDGFIRDGDAAEQFLAKYGTLVESRLKEFGTCATYEEFENVFGFHVYRCVFPLLVVCLKNETHPKMARAVSYVGGYLMAILKSELTVREGTNRQEIDSMVVTRLLAGFWTELVIMANLAEELEMGYQVFVARQGENIRHIFYDRAWYLIKPDGWQYEQPLVTPYTLLEEAIASLEREQGATS